MTKNDWDPEICREFFRIWPPNFFKAELKIPLQNLRSSDNSTLILKITRKKILKPYSVLLFWARSVLRISRTEIWAILFNFAIIWTQNPQLGRYWADNHRECLVISRDRDSFSLVSHHGSIFILCGAIWNQRSKIHRFRKISNIECRVI